MNCRFCKKPLNEVFVDLGVSPLSNAYVKEEFANNKEVFYPLKPMICSDCFLIQLPELEKVENIFAKDYAYFSSFSQTWLNHSKRYVNEMVKRFNFNNQSLIIEIASNDGYLLQYFKEKGIPVLGIEPARNVAEAAIKKGIPTLIRFFNTTLAKELMSEKKMADLIIGNNVLAHVPNLNDFIIGMKIILKPEGLITMEFPHLLRLIEDNQFDTIYHEHFSYFSFLTVEKTFTHHGLTIFDVDEIPTHGGSLRIYACHTESGKEISENVQELKKREKEIGIMDIDFYRSFSEKVKKTKREILSFLIELKESGSKIAAYGAPAKGNTLLNYCGIRTDFIDYTVDRNPHKQGCYLPGSRIPIYHPDRLRETKPDYVIILPWNLKDEIIEQVSYIREWGGKFVTLIPSVKVY